MVVVLSPREHVLYLRRRLHHHRRRHLSLESLPVLCAHEAGRTAEPLVSLTPMICDIHPRIGICLLFH